MGNKLTLNEIKQDKLNFNWSENFEGDMVHLMSYFCEMYTSGGFELFQIGFRKH